MNYYVRNSILKETTLFSRKVATAFEPSLYAGHISVQQEQTRILQPA
jgi:hypothetical protein